MSHDWFESVAVAQRRAKRRLPASVYGALIAGTEAGLSMRDNTAAFDELGFRPITAGQPPERSLETTILGEPASMPVMIAPTGVQAVHPLGEVAVARAAAARGIPMGLSSFASTALEDVVRAQPSTFFQVYWVGDRDAGVARLERARAAGAKGVILTLDWSFSHARDWGSPHIPQSFTLGELLPHALEVLARPRYLWSWLRHGRLPMLRVPSFLADRSATPPRFFEAYGAWMATPPPSWDDVAWLRSQWKGPFMVKGISRPDEARRAVDAGCTAISVSNHGGNNLDGAPASIRTLPEIARAVGDEVEVLLDGGVRRGSDIVKALALGAHAVLIGRAYLWGLAVHGQAGVENVLDLLRSGLDATLRGIGVRALADLRPDHVCVPDGFCPPPMPRLPKAE